MLDKIWDGLANIPYGIDLVKLAFVFIVSWLSYVVSQKYLLGLINKILTKTKTKWDDVLIKNKVFNQLILLIPAMVFYYGLKALPTLFSYGQKIVSIYVTFIIILVVNKLLDSFVDIYNTYPISARRPIKGYLQLVKIFVYIIGGIFLISIILDKSPWGLISGIGALTAVLMLIFKDTVLSFVASIQIASYDLLRKGDWIEMPAFGADGDVIDIALHTVKVQNFDKTIVAIPTFKFLDHSFKNWRGMEEAGARRIKRSILIDQSSIKFLDDELMERLSKIDILKSYLEQKRIEIEEHNKNVGASPESVLNGRRLTNLGTLRAYILAYLKSHPNIRQDLTLIVRHLQPTADKGLPLEIYCFVNDTNWANYEAIQADIFDHILAALPEFHLRAYQRNALVDRRI
ncbi:mechanosensitive ion channel family protein [Desulfohalobiaceae bacterium Ax17]|uniref:mechanosensitive ion channel family protein n=1 Tax=Desulfovulcanus ferrireducens TaxID=2831190 RepID=UPI00207BAA9D|nr:mechanosensitive ion channel domain-containing protein [Desulfovulcanus ferrireducens]MBT8763553.1 mechanosensitive ion channel family protein [Desulfovulcanus ferrireducens]